MEEEVRKWLETQGYPLEMKVARLFRSARFRVFQSEYYVDSSGVSRETDVTAHVDSQNDELLVRVKFVIECKSTPEKPWILFTGGRALADPARVAQRAASTLGRKVLMQLCQRKDIQNLALFHVHEKATYGITQAFTTGSDVTFAAATSVSNATAAEVAMADRYTKAGQPICLIAIPVVVINAPLVEAYLDENGCLVVTPADSGTLVWRNRLVGAPHTLIRVLRIDEVESYVQEMFETCLQFFELAQNTVRAVKEERESAT